MGMGKDPYAVPAVPAPAKVTGPKAPKQPPAKQLGSAQLGFNPRRPAPKTPAFNKFVKKGA